MKKIIIILVAGMIIISSSQLMALGVGGYVNLGGNYSDLYKPTPKVNYLSFVFGFGFAINLDLVQNDFLKYRINIGYERLINDDLKFKYFNRISLINSFGFKLIQNDNFRLYAGPQIAFRYQFCNTDYIMGNKLFWKQHYDINSFGLGIGAIFGVDVKLTEKIIISPEIGLRYEFHTGKAKNKVAYIFFPYRYTKYQTITGHGFEGCLQVTVLYKLDYQNI